MNYYIADIRDLHHIKVFDKPFNHEHRAMEYIEINLGFDYDSFDVLTEKEVNKYDLTTVILPLRSSKYLYPPGLNSDSKRKYRRNLTQRLKKSGGVYTTVIQGKGLRSYPIMEAAKVMPGLRKNCFFLDRNPEFIYCTLISKPTLVDSKIIWYSIFCAAYNKDTHSVRPKQVHVYRRDNIMDLTLHEFASNLQEGYEVTKRVDNPTELAYYKKFGF